MQRLSPITAVGPGQPGGKSTGPKRRTIGRLAAGLRRSGSPLSTSIRPPRVVRKMPLTIISVYSDTVIVVTVIERLPIIIYRFPRSSPAAQPDPRVSPTTELQNAERNGAARLTRAVPIFRADTRSRKLAMGCEAAAVALPELTKKKATRRTRRRLKGSDTSVSSPKRQTAEAVRSHILATWALSQV